MNKSLLFGLGGLMIGVILSSLFFSQQVSNTNQSVILQPTEAMQHDMNTMKEMTMNDMVTDLQNKTGDDFDKAFISGMIEHHQGAIDMAKRAKQDAKHAELKKMADDIISAQAKEIEMMKQWQKEWGY